MYYDALTLAAVRDELAARLLGGRVQHIVQPSPLALGLEIYAGERHHLLLSAEASDAGAFLMPLKLRRGTETPSPLQLRLVKHVRDARLIALHQPSLERVLRLTFDGEYGPVDLVGEFMGRYSNLILVGPDGDVMEAAKRIPAALNRYRVTLPGQPYVPPPPQAKDHPLQVSVTQLRLLLTGQPKGTLAERLVNVLTGISPLLAREIVYRALGRRAAPEIVQQEVCARLLSVIEVLLRLPETHVWSPCVACEGQGAERQPVAYAPYDLTHWPDRAPATSISAAIQRVAEAREAFDAYRPARARLHALLAEQVARQETRLASLRRSLVPKEESEALMRHGNAVLALAWTLRPGQRELVVDAEQWASLGEEPRAEPMRIPLDPTLSPAENAQQLFREYRKSQAATRQVPALIAETERELAYLAQLAAEVDLAENRVQLDEVERELEEAGHLAHAGRRTKPSGKSQPSSVHAPDGALILVGRNSRQNHEVTFRRAAPDDLWLHAHGLPGAHVIVKGGGGAISEATLQLAARLAARYSPARQEAKVTVDCTARRYVRPIKDGHPGMVTYSHARTLVVTPEET